jgi:hypothetical protein
MMETWPIPGRTISTKIWDTNRSDCSTWPTSPAVAHSAA